jgi:DNA-binding MarR family transcriptional regulator
VDHDMTAPQPPALPLGTTVAFAQRALTAALHDHLAKVGTAPGTWYALNSLVLRPGIGTGALRRELAQAPDVDPSSTSELLDRLASEGLIRLDADQASLTAEGEAAHRWLRESITGLTAQLLSPFDPNDVETTMRTLRAVTERATGRDASSMV